MGGTKNRYILLYLIPYSTRQYAHLGIAARAQRLEQNEVIDDVAVLQPAPADRGGVFQLLLLRKLRLLAGDVSRVLDLRLPLRDHPSMCGERSVWHERTTFGRSNPFSEPYPCVQGKTTWDKSWIRSAVVNLRGEN